MQPPSARHDVQRFVRTADLDKVYAAVGKVSLRPT